MGVSNKEPPDPTTLVLQAQLGKSYGLDLEAQIHNLSIDGYTRSWFFLENNNKTQTISLVRKRLKLFWFLAIRVNRTRFLQLLNDFLRKNVRRKRVQRTRFSLQRNRVLRTRFLCIENESNGLVFYAQKPSPLDLVSMYRNRVHWTRFLCIETESIGLDFSAKKTESFGLVFCVRFFLERNEQL